jgi:hypothetical protein
LKKLILKNSIQKIEFEEQPASYLKIDSDIFNQNLKILEKLQKIQKLNDIVQENPDSNQDLIGFDGEDLDPIYRYAIKSNPFLFSSNKSVQKLTIRVRNN